MKIGDLVKFTGSWLPSQGLRRTGIVMKVWSNGRTHKKQSADILWDSGDLHQSSIHMLEIISAAG